MIDTLKGTGVAMVTPFDQNGEIDWAGFEKLIQYLIDGGVDYLVVLGTTGETPVLSKTEKKALITFTYEQVNKRIPIVVGVGGNDTRQVIEDLHQLPLDQATAILSAAPYYNKPSQEGLFQHYKHLADASPKPLILYNVPGRTGRNMATTTTLRLAHEVQNIIGVKEASGDMQQCMDILRGRPDGFLVLSGDDALALPQLACGMDGVISVAANAYPQLFSNMVRACCSGDFSTARSFNNQLMPAYDLMFEENNPAGVKAFLHHLGIIQNVVRLPLVPLSKPVHEKVQQWLASQ
ncbi:MAG: 4-hydroxy-tetrahydrodipicolinate synthase [Ferruginibacter sp.]